MLRLTVCFGLEVRPVVRGGADHGVRWQRDGTLPTPESFYQACSGINVIRTEAVCGLTWQWPPKQASVRCPGL